MNDFEKIKEVVVNGERVSFYSGQYDFGMVKHTKENNKRFSKKMFSVVAVPILITAVVVALNIFTAYFMSSRGVFAKEHLTTTEGLMFVFSILLICADITGFFVIFSGVLKDVFLDIVDMFSSKKRFGLYARINGTVEILDGRFRYSYGSGRGLSEYISSSDNATIVQFMEDLEQLKVGDEKLEKITKILHKSEADEHMIRDLQVKSDELEKEMAILGESVKSRMDEAEKISNDLSRRRANKEVMDLLVA